MPVLGRPLDVDIEHDTSTRSTTETDIQYGVGRSLVLQINTVMKLTRQMRTENE
jgi:hypothetical protein